MYDLRISTRHEQKQQNKRLNAKLGAVSISKERKQTQGKRNEVILKVFKMSALTVLKRDNRGAVRSGRLLDKNSDVNRH